MASTTSKIATNAEAINILYLPRGLGIPLNTLEHTEVEINRGRGTATLISTEARIASNKLLLRTQTCILGSPKPKTGSNKIHALSLCRRIGITLCSGPPMGGHMDNRFVKALSPPSMICRGSVGIAFPIIVSIFSISVD